MAATTLLCRSFARALAAAVRGRTRKDHRPAKALAVISSGVLLMMSVGAMPAPQAEAEARAHRKAWFDAKSICVFPLGSMPTDREQLTAALIEGWKRSITLPDPEKVIKVEGDDYPTLRELQIDLSGGELKTSKKQKVRLSNNVESSLAVDHLEVRGQPLLLQHAKLNMSIIANNAQLDLERGKGGRPLMMLADASSGTLQFDVSQRDVQELLLKNARELAGKYGVKVEETKLTLTPETPRSIGARLHILTKVGFVPAGMLFKAHVTIDDQMNARITGLTVDGDEALGPIIVGILRPALLDYNNKTRPLVSFPAGKLQLRDIALKVDDSLHLKASFGS